MNPAADYMYSAAEIVTAINAQMEALTLEVDDPANPGNQLKAFERVEVFDVQSMVEAFRRAIISEQRVCIIVLLDEQLTTDIQEQKILITRMQPVALIISDRRIGDPVKAQFGDPQDATIPGTIALVKAAKAALTGMLLPPDNNKTKVISIPSVVTSMFMKDEDQQDLPGRSAMMLEIHCTGGELEAYIGPGSSL